MIRRDLLAGVIAVSVAACADSLWSQPLPVAVTATAEARQMWAFDKQESYAEYLGGDEGYTASACDGVDWYDQLFWLGVRRAPPAWHHWTFDVDPEVGLRRAA